MNAWLVGRSASVDFAPLLRFSSATRARART
jgi:hypothetical protein